MSALTIKKQRGQFEGMGDEGRRAHDIFDKNREEKRKTEGFYHFPKNLSYNIQLLPKCLIIILADFSLL